MKRLALILGIVLALASTSFAAGSACTAIVEKVDGIRYVHWSWTSDDSTGAVTCSGKGSVIISGIILGIKFTPAAASTIPTDAYDVVMNNATGADVAMGVGANLTNDDALTTQWKYPENTNAGSIVLYKETISPAITNAGNSKTGTITMAVY